MVAIPCRFESGHRHHVGASYVSLAPIFYKNQSALTSLLLLSAKSHARLTCSVVNALATVRCRYQLFASCGDVSPPAKTVKTSPPQAAYRLLRLFSKVKACSFRCSSFSAKGRVRVACSLAGALTTALAHYQPFAGTQGGCIFFVVPYHVGAKSALLRLIFLQK